MTQKVITLCHTKGEVSVSGLSADEEDAVYEAVTANERLGAHVWAVVGVPYIFSVRIADEVTNAEACLALFNFIRNFCEQLGHEVFVTE